VTLLAYLVVVLLCGVALIAGVAIIARYIFAFISSKCLDQTPGHTKESSPVNLVLIPSFYRMSTSKLSVCVIASFGAVIVLAAIFWSWSNLKPDPLDAMISHTSAMLKIIKDNKADCNKVVSELEAYTKAHQKEFAQIKKQGEEMEKNMSEDDKKKYAEKAIKRMGGLIRESMATIMEINQKCSDQAAKIGEAMRAIK